MVYNLYLYLGAKLMVAVSFQKKRERSKNEVRRKYILSTVKEIGLGKMNKLLKQTRTMVRFKKIHVSL